MCFNLRLIFVLIPAYVTVINPVWDEYDRCSRTFGARARSPIAKKNWKTHECEKFWLGYDVTCPSVRTQSHNAYAPVFVWREVAWRDVFTTEMLKNRKCKVNLYVFVGYVDKGGKERKRPTGKVSLKKLHICLYHPFVISYGNF